MGLVFTHPAVWFPIAVAGIAVLVRCGQIIWAIVAAMNSPQHLPNAGNEVVTDGNQTALQLQGAPVKREATHFVVLAGFAGVLLYMATVFVAASLAYRFARVTEKGHRIR